MVEGIDEGEEVGGVEEDPAGVEVTVADQVVGQVTFDEFDGLGRDAGHVVPEALAGQLLGADIQEAAQGGALEPAGHPDLAAGGDAAVDGGQEQVGTDGGPGAGLGDVAVDMVAQFQSLGDVIQGHDGAEVGDDSLARPGRRVGVGSGGSQGGDDVVGTAEVLLPDDGGLAVDAAALAGVVVGPAADGFLDDARHRVGHT